MERVTCAFCGLPFRVRLAPPGTRHYCCSGCALASRIPMDGDRLPVSRGLIIALVLSFGLFNQILFTALAVATAAEGRQDQADLIALVAQVVGGVLAVACIGFLVTARTRRFSDGLFLGVAVLAGGVAVSRGWWADRAATGWCLLGLNGALALWLARGWMRRAWQRRKSSD